MKKVGSEKIDERLREEFSELVNERLKGSTNASEPRLDIFFCNL